MEINTPISLFSRVNEPAGSESSDDDVWDDTALIEAYDRAVSLAKEEVQRRISNKSSKSGGVSSTVAIRTKKDKKKTSKKSKSALSSNSCQWKIGMPCRTAYEEDGQLYEAVIETMSIEDGVCLVKFLGYGNQQLTSINDLLPSQGRLAQNSQIHEAQPCSDGDGMDWTNNQDGTRTVDTSNTSKPDVAFTRSAPTHSLPFPPPPPPTQFTGGLPTDESEALSSMLMSWYLNGFHTVSSFFFILMEMT
ncbi:hypothetical protein B566_EDAN000683 [Ephemera danica]|nr:hypothetical protein B566_EDAN000683 [Ephemera danica]